MNSLVGVLVGAIGLAVMQPPLPDLSPLAERVVFGGRNVTRNDDIAKSVVGVAVPDGKMFDLCTGVLVAPRVVLTAGHCMIGKTDKAVVIFRRSLLNAPQSAFRVVEKYAVPSGFDADVADGSDPNDVAVILLDRPAPSTAVPLPVSLIPVPPLAKGVMLAGYGAAKYDQKKDRISGNAGFALRTAAAEIVDWSALITLDQSKSGVCRGDSGGPIYAEVGDRLALIATITGVVYPADATEACRSAGRAAVTANWVSWINLRLARWGLPPIQTIEPPFDLGIPPAGTFATTECCRLPDDGNRPAGRRAAPLARGRSLAEISPAS
jgi:V8-like Glu-specific endopeptidase